MIKQVPNMITVLRMLCSSVLLLAKPLSIAFFILYLVCGVSDVLDGYIARKCGAATPLGETLDSIADIVFFTVMLIVFIPLLQWQWWMFILFSVIAGIRLLSIGIGFVKYHALACLHTYSNKAAGVLLFLFPFIYSVAGLTVTAILLCSITLLSSIEELAINIISKAFHKNVRCIFDVFWL